VGSSDRQFVSYLRHAAGRLVLVVELSSEVRPELLQFVRQRIPPDLSAPAGQCIHCGSTGRGAIRVRDRGRHQVPPDFRYVELGVSVARTCDGAARGGVRGTVPETSALEHEITRILMQQ